MHSSESFFVIKNRLKMTFKWLILKHMFCFVSLTLKDFTCSYKKRFLIKKWSKRVTKTGPGGPKKWKVYKSWAPPLRTPLCHEDFPHQKGAPTRTFLIKSVQRVKKSKKWHVRRGGRGGGLFGPLFSATQNVSQGTEKKAGNMKRGGVNVRKVGCQY